MSEKENINKRCYFFGMEAMGFLYSITISTIDKKYDTCVIKTIGGRNIIGLYSQLRFMK